MADNDLYPRIYEICRTIPAGRVTTYGAIARAVGVASGARMVGYALNASIESENAVPAHRVVNRLGQLTGRAYFPGDTMRERLKQEGISFTGEYTVDIEKHFWEPGEKMQA
ncbi:MGMT family protein [Rhodohalobacter sp. SW132]|uniref:MGMT family protein n=1 Tax=Rhodohalobacter sp. SW132 TaxID=2293433 RepID=UPI000E26D16A|nr:MGMT family protein [Rhodohalobacter sp. SW132]REL38182.1 MGMT family protein [Rhodohalobacter sp. SW132]